MQVLKSIESHYLDKIQPSLGLAGSFEFLILCKQTNVICQE